MEVLLLPAALEALGNTGEALWAARRASPRMALLCTARPLSFTWTPDGRGIVAVSASSTKCLLYLDMPAGCAPCCLASVLMGCSQMTGATLTTIDHRSAPSLSSRDPCGA